MTDTVEQLQTIEAKLGEELMTGYVDFMRRMPKTWEFLDERAQENQLEMLRILVVQQNRKCIRAALAGQFVAVEAQISGLGFKDSIRLGVTVSKGVPTEQKVAIIDRVGQPILLLLTQPEHFEARLKEIKAQKDQGELFKAEPTLRSAEDEAIDKAAKETPVWTPPKKGAVAAEPPAQDEPKPGSFEIIEPASPGEQPEAGDKPLTMLEQAESFLEAIGKPTKDLNKRESKVAITWALAFLQDDAAAPARPHFLPLPPNWVLRNFGKMPGGQPDA